MQFSNLDDHPNKDIYLKISNKNKTADNLLKLSNPLYIRTIMARFSHILG